MQWARIILGAALATSIALVGCGGDAQETIPDADTTTTNDAAIADAADTLDAQMDVWVITESVEETTTVFTPEGGEPQEYTSTSTSSNEYDEHGNKTKVTTVNVNDGGTFTTETVSTYDDDGYILESSTTNISGEDDSQTDTVTYEYERNDAEQVVAYTETTDAISNWSNQHTEYEYGANGFWSLVTSFYTDTSQGYEDEPGYVHDVVNKTVYNEDGTVAYATFTTTNHEDASPVSEETYTYTYEYDDAGRVTKRVDTSDANEAYEGVTVYTYDDNGNLAAEDVSYGSDAITVTVSKTYTWEKVDTPSVYARQLYHLQP